MTAPRVLDVAGVAREDALVDDVGVDASGSVERGRGLHRLEQRR